MAATSSSNAVAHENKDNAQAPPQRKVVIVRLRAHGERFEVPVYSGLYEIWRTTGEVPYEDRQKAFVAPAQIVAASGTLKTKGKGKKNKRGQRRGADDDDDGGSSDGDDDPEQQVIIEGVFALLADKQNIYLNCFRRTLATKKALLAAFGTTSDQNLAFIASAIIRRGTVVETDTARAVKRAELSTLRDKIRDRVAGGGMLLNRFAGIAAERAEVDAVLSPAAAKAAAAASGLGGTLDSDVFGDEFIDVDFGVSGGAAPAATGLAEVAAKWLQLGADSWVVAAWTAHKAIHADAEAPALPDFLRHAVAVELGCTATTSGGGASLSPAKAFAMLAACMEGVVVEPPERTVAVLRKVLDKGAPAKQQSVAPISSEADEPSKSNATSASTIVLVDAATIGVAAGKDPTRDPVAALAPLQHALDVTFPPAGTYTLSIDRWAPLPLPDHAATLEYFTRRSVDIEASHALLRDADASAASGSTMAQATMAPPADAAVVAAAVEAKVKGGGTGRAAKLGNMTNAQLQSECKRLGLGTGGKKATLVERILAAERDANGGDDSDGSSDSEDGGRGKGRNKGRGRR